jgi:predicted acylesterase/phospholipase RssA
MRWALLLSGGTALGAVQVPVVEHLWRELGPPSVIAGVSVGAVNALALADGDLASLRRIWQDVDGARWFQRPQLDVWNGLFSLGPLRRQVTRRGKGQPMRIPVLVGAVDIAAQRYRTLPLAELDWPDRVDATVASATQPGIHERARYRGRWYVDGGVEHLLPWLPDWQSYDFIAGVFCSPLRGHRRKLRTQAQVAQSWEQAGAALEMLLARVARDDLRRLRRWGRRVPVVAYAPPSWDSVGAAFDADPATIEQRFQTGAAMLMRPVLGQLPGS